MKIKAIDEQAYYNLNNMKITAGKVYEVVDGLRNGRAFIVVGDDGKKVFLDPTEYEELDNNEF